MKPYRMKLRPFITNKGNMKCMKLESKAALSKDDWGTKAALCSVDWGTSWIYKEHSRVSLYL